VICHESGLCLRMFAPVAALFADPCRLTGSGSLSRRPAGMIAKALSSFGVAVTTSGGNIPLDVRGPLRGGAQEIDGSESSQHITGLLIALPLAPDSSLVTVRPLSSRPYIDLTLNMVRQFGGAVAEDASPSVGGAVFRIDGGQGYRGCECEIEGDWSAAAFILAAAALTGQATVTGLSLASAQADRRILDALTAAGAAVTAGDSAVTVERRALRGFEFDCVHCPDLFPPLAAVAAFCQGTTRLTGANRLAGKESDRAAALEAELSRIGAKINRTGDVLEIIGGHVSGGEVSAHNDHRIAMAAAVAGLASRHGVTIAGAECTAKSWPDFFAVLGGMRNDECGRRNAE